MSVNWLPTRIVLLFYSSICFFLLQGIAWSSEYKFDLDEFEKKSFDWGGYAELKWDRIDINQDGALARLNSYQDTRSSLDRISSILQLDGNLNKGIVDFNWLMQASAQQDQTAWGDSVDIFAAYASIKPTPMVTVDLGKKVFKWGKGYAWNPVGFIDRPKDLNNPEDSLEGYVGAGLDLIKSFSGPLQTVALTSVALPAWQEVNEDFGEINNINFAVKLYLLYWNTDIDFVLFSGNSRSKRYGVDFSRNVTTNFEIHAELAHIPDQMVRLLAADGSLATCEQPDTSYLLGFRYLTVNDITTIVEYYHNDDGYTSSESDHYYQLIRDAQVQFDSTGANTLFQKAAADNLNGYNKPQSGRNYLYAKVTQKEPFNLLYFTPGVTAITNLDDGSYSVSPEAVYTGFTNWEMRLRFSWLNGDYNSEYGEKTNTNRAEVRLRYFF
nr:hypothetical protein [Desulfobulbaceae bacterium]